ncbi:hypothetical protein D3C71_1870790 [compost metagenome]
MNKRTPLIEDDGEVRELSVDDLAEFRPAAEVLPAGLARTLGVRGPQKAPTKVATTIRFDQDVLAALKATGRGWQTRANDLLRADIEAGRL